METDKKSNGAFLGLIVIIIILIAGGIYILMSSQNTATEPQSQIQSDVTGNQDATALDALDQDLQTTDTNITIDTNTVN